MSRRLLTFCLFCAALLMGGASVRAAVVSVPDLLDAKLDYVADFYLNTSARGSYDGEVIHAPGRERREFDTRQGHQVLLLRRDIDQVAMIWPERKWYISTSFTEAAQMVGGFDGATLDRRKSGSETVAGERCVRYDVNGGDGQRGEFHGRMWMTHDGILMKLAGTVRFQGRDMKVEMGLRNLRRMKADPAAFVVPSDYIGVPLKLSNFGGH